MEISKSPPNNSNHTTSANIEKQPWVTPQLVKLPVSATQTGTISSAKEGVLTVGSLAFGSNTTIS